jgi:hypothetical protein
VVHNKLIIYGEVLAPFSAPKVEDHPLLAVQSCLFKVFAATPDSWRLLSVHNLRTRHAVMTRDPPTMVICSNLSFICNLVDYRFVDSAGSQSLCRLVICKEYHTLPFE